MSPPKNVSSYTIKSLVYLNIPRTIFPFMFFYMFKKSYFMSFYVKFKYVPNFTFHSHKYLTSIYRSLNLSSKSNIANMCAMVSTKPLVGVAYIKSHPAMQPTSTLHKIKPINLIFPNINKSLSI